MDTIEYLSGMPRFIVAVMVFALGSVVGSLLNVVAYRLPLDKSLFWPGSRCGHCLQPIRVRDNIPLLSYWLLRGRCRDCGTSFSIRYFLVELFTACLFVGLFLVEVVWNWQDVPDLNSGGIYEPLVYSWKAWAMFVVHATLVSLLIGASLCDLDGRTIPLSLTLTGTVLGLVAAVLFPWPWPNPATHHRLTAISGEKPWWALDPDVVIPAGLYVWPAWGPLPEWMPPGSWACGLVTGIVGALVGSWLVRGIKWVFETALQREALGLGDADLMMMAGAFVGWQMTVTAFFVGAIASLGMAVWQILVNKDRSMPFGPGLAVGVVLTWLLWPWLGLSLRGLFFDSFILPFVTIMTAVMLFVMALVMNRLLPKATEESQ